MRLLTKRILIALAIFYVLAFVVVYFNQYQLGIWVMCSMAIGFFLMSPLLFLIFYDKESWENNCLDFIFKNHPEYIKFDECKKCARTIYYCKEDGYWDHIEKDNDRERGFSPCCIFGGLHTPNNHHLKEYKFGENTESFWESKFKETKKRPK